MAELKPCPFCGGEAIYMATSEGPDFSSGFVRCKKLCCEQSYILPKHGAIKYWNRRHEEPKEIEFDYEAED